MIEELPDDIEQDELDDIEPVGDENQLYEHFRVVVDKGQAMVRVDKYLFERIVNASRNRIQKAAEDGFVMANGKPVKSSYKVKPLDVITVMMDRPRYDNEIIPEDIPLHIVYEDKYLMVVNKPAGLVVHPGHGNYMVRWSMPSPGISRITPITMPTTHMWDWCTASIKILPDYWLSLRHRMPKPIWASNSLIKLLNADTAHWYGALSIRMKVPS